LQYFLAEASELREDEPHPMADFPTALKLRADAFIGRCLGVDEALEVEVVVQ
jgi:hypothetical protein